MTWFSEKKSSLVSCWSYRSGGGNVNYFFLHTECCHSRPHVSVTAFSYLYIAGCFCRSLHNSTIMPVFSVSHISEHTVITEPLTAHCVNYIHSMNTSQIIYTEWKVGRKKTKSVWMMAPCNKLQEYAKLPADDCLYWVIVCGQMVENYFTLASVINLFTT